jgi:uncharacterized membrane protein YuzA (DUF378 family)
MVLIQAALDHLGQLIFLAFVVSALLRSRYEEPLDLLNQRGALFACSFVLSLRLLLPMAATLYTAAMGSRELLLNSTHFIILTLPAFVLALLVGVFSLVASIFGSRSAVCIILLSVAGLCLALNTFIALRLVGIQRRTASGQSSAKQHNKGKEANKDGYLVSTMSTAGTKASSANPYDQVKEKEQDKPVREEKEHGDVIESEHSAATAANESISSLWLNQQMSNDVHHTYHQGSIDDEVLLTPPPNASFRSLDGEAPLSPPEIGLDRGGGRLRISPSAREMMVTLTTPMDFYEPAVSFDLNLILVGLAGMWLISVSI